MPEDVIVEKEHYEVICETGQYDKLADAFSKAEVSPGFIRIGLPAGKLGSRYG